MLSIHVCTFLLIYLHTQRYQNLRNIFYISGADVMIAIFSDFLLTLLKLPPFPQTLAGLDLTAHS
jgi:hypothetical protein